jgi:type IV fimbrial biogenesis protein FimT
MDLIPSLPAAAQRDKRTMKYFTKAADMKETKRVGRRDFSSRIQAITPSIRPIRPFIRIHMTRCGMSVITVAMKKTQTGFTLIELMMALAIGGILLTLAVPSFNATMRSNRLTSYANNLVTAFNLARSEAIERRSTITVCSSSDQATCTNSSWSDGWIVMNPTTNEVLRIFDPMKGNPTITRAANSVTYTSQGFINGGVAVSIKVCMDSGQQGRQIDVTATGRPNNLSPYPTC